MNALILLNQALEYIEENLEAELRIEDISKIACSSRQHFQYVFYALTGVTVTRYIKNRRLTLAAEELVKTDKRVIDIALQYGYETPEAFTKAFKRLHGISPAMLKKSQGTIKAFPKISFELDIKGQSEMTYRIVEKEAFRVVGVELVTTVINDVVYKQIPEFINEIFKNGTHDKINKLLQNPKGTLLNGFHYGFEEDGTRRYMMGDEWGRIDNLDEFTVLEISKLTWAVFEGSGDRPSNLIIQNIWRRIYSEWFPSSGFQQVEGMCIEKNFWNHEEQGEYRCEVWIPIKR